MLLQFAHSEQWDPQYLLSLANSERFNLGLPVFAFGTAGLAAHSPLILRSEQSRAVEETIRNMNIQIKPLGNKVEVNKMFP